MLLGVITALCTAAYLEAARGAREGARDRLASVAGQYALAFDSSALRLKAHLDSNASHPALLGFLRGATPRARQAAEAALPYRGGRPEQVAAVGLWDANGRALLAHGRVGGRLDSAFAGAVVAEVGALDSARLGGFRVLGDSMYYPAVTSLRAGSERLGYLVQWRYVGATPQALEQLMRLIGPGATMLIGSPSNGAWTNLLGPIDGPPIDLRAAPKPGLLAYDRAGAGSRLAMLAPIPRAGWVVVMEFPRGTVLAPARLFLRRLILLAMVFLVGGLAAAWAVGRRITTPLRALTDATEAMVGADYTRRVPVERRDELGRLAHTFNRAAERVQQVQDGLERTVADRTAELQSALHRLQDNEVTLRQLLDSLPVAVYVVDAAGRPQFANRMSQEILGRGIAPDTTAEELARVHQAYRVGTGEVYPGDQQPILHALKGRAAHAADFEIRRPDRAVRIEVWAAPVYGADGQLASAVAAFTDITERERERAEIERLNGELARRIAELETVNAELDTFCYSVSHDLRAPLRAIDGFSRMLQEDYRATLDAEAQRLLGVIRSSTSGMGQLIDDLLTFSRLSRKQLEEGRVDMTALARAVMEDARAAAGPPPAAATPPRVNLGSLPPTRGDGALLRQAWVNLISNALKFSRTKPEPVVEIGARKQNGEAVYFVRDNGVGFDMQYADKLFGVFQRLHRADEFEGTGVGLAIVQRVVHRHGGRVWAEAAQGQGATFYFSLPMAEALT
ncbi:MAG TPA: ATP-binding protein [Gemmatimonadales bacterium]|nr:ATP-binding protein [Gemmatimonadales bacterium]